MLVASAQPRVVGDLSFEGYGYDAQLLRMPVGAFMITDLVNELDAPTTIHWHGAGAPYEMDGTPEEIAAANCFFLGEESAFVTGQTIYADGGSSIGHAPV